MDIIQKFGNAVSSMSLEDPGRRAGFFLQDTDFRRNDCSFFQIKNCPSRDSM